MTVYDGDLHALRLQGGYAFPRLSAIARTILAFCVAITA
jgi:hypothetical protein